MAIENTTDSVEGAGPGFPASQPADTALRAGADNSVSGPATLIPPERPDLAANQVVGVIGDPGMVGNLGAEGEVLGCNSPCVLQGGRRPRNAENSGGRPGTKASVSSLRHVVAAPSVKLNDCPTRISRAVVLANECHVSTSCREGTFLVGQ
jgi:hypothetical protein